MSFRSATLPSVRACFAPVPRSRAQTAIGLASVSLVIAATLLNGVTCLASASEPPVAFVPAEDLTAESRPVAHVSIQGFQYAPSRLKVSQGTTVLWTNRDGVDHDVTLLQGDLASSLVGRGGEIAIVFRGAGKYRYYCHVHPFMQGTVIVE